MSAWVLPDHIADVLPAEARHIEELRRELLDTACGYGYELVMPPLAEHLESLLTGTGEALRLQTFKVVDQLEGLQVQRLAGAGEERLEVLQQRRHDQLVAVAARRIEQFASEFFDVPGL